MRGVLFSLAVVSTLQAAALVHELPGRYFLLMEAGARQLDARLTAEPNADLESLEKTPGWKHFGYAILPPAVLYAKHDPGNPRYHDPGMLALAIRIGDLLASENEKGKFAPRLDPDWDTYMWLEAYRLIAPQLGHQRCERWRRAILENAAQVAPVAVRMFDFPWYQAPFIGTSPNHYAQYAQLLFLAGRVFDKPDWVKLGSEILHRFATTEQAPDGFWGEHSQSGPTIGYDHVTLSTVAVYWELTGDPAALEALRRSTNFHMHFTYPDGTPVETMNDRNRYWMDQSLLTEVGHVPFATGDNRNYWGVCPWAHFAFTHFPEGRRYAEFLAGFFEPDKLTMDALGRLSQDALYYHEGKTAPIPQDLGSYVYQTKVPAGIRKTGPWIVSLSGIVEPQQVNNEFFLDRQANLSVFHSKLGLIISGANSKRQPELATFREALNGVVYHLPLSSRLEMDVQEDRLSLAFNSFSSFVCVPRPSEHELKFRFTINGKGKEPDEAVLTLQLVLKAGEILETAAGRRITLGTDRVQLNPEAIGGWVRHAGWTLRVDPTARLAWPVYPFDPYANDFEKTLNHAVGAVSVPLRLKLRPGNSCARTNRRSGSRL